MSQKDKHDCMQCERKKEIIERLREENTDMSAALCLAQFNKKKNILAEKEQRVQLQELLDKMEGLNKKLMHLKERAPTFENINITTDAFADPGMVKFLEQVQQAQQEWNKKEQVLQALRAKKNGDRKSVV